MVLEKYGSYCTHIESLAPTDYNLEKHAELEEILKLLWNLLWGCVVRGLVGSDLHSETKGSWFESHG